MTTSAKFYTVPESLCLKPPTTLLFVQQIFLDHIKIRYVLWGEYFVDRWFPDARNGESIVTCCLMIIYGHDNSNFPKNSTLSRNRLKFGKVFSYRYQYPQSCHINSHDINPTESIKRYHFKVVSHWHRCLPGGQFHYSDVIMSAMASQAIGVSIVYSTVCSGKAPPHWPLWG